MNDEFLSLQEVLPRFLRRCDAESTRVAYERELRRFLAWLGPEIGDEVLFDYRDYLRDRGLGPTTIQWRTTVPGRSSDSPRGAAVSTVRSLATFPRLKENPGSPRVFSRLGT